MKLRPGDKAWIALGIGVATYEGLALPDELMSEAADRYMLRHPWLVRFIAFALAAHVCNAIPARYDVVHWLFVGKQALSKTAKPH